MLKLQFGINVNAHVVTQALGSNKLPRPDLLRDANVDWIRIVFMYGDLKERNYRQHYGNKPIRQAVDALDQTINGVNPILDHRRYIEHVQTSSPKTMSWSS